MMSEEPPLRRALAELGIDVPVSLVKVIGDRMELTLYGGKVMVWPRQGGKGPVAAALLANPERYRRPELRQAARRLGIAGGHLMKKAALIEAIRAWAAGGGEPEPPFPAH